jgi:Sulfatase
MGGCAFSGHDHASGGASGAAAQSGAPATRQPLVVMVVFDEFPVDDMVTPDGQIDAARYPNFATLAREGTWFRNAASVYDSTFKAVPSILDAKLPARMTAPDARSHRKSLYTLFHELGWDIVDTESGTAICPPNICRGARRTRPGVLARLSGGGRPSRLNTWIHSIRPRDKPTLYFQHALMPHEPWIYLPSGRQSRPSGNDPIPGINRPIGFHDPDLVRHNHARHLLQAGYTDHELGRLLSRLRRQGLYDRATIAITADHGIAFEVGVNDHRLVTPSNVEQIAPVPLFIKAPHQKKGGIDTTYVRTIDVVPTVASLENAKLDWAHDGRSVFSRASRPRSVAMVSRDFTHTVRIDGRELERRRKARREEWARSFGTGFEGIVSYGSPWAQLYRIGPHPELIGRPLKAAGAPKGNRASIANAGLYANVNTRTRLFPTHFEGPLTGNPPGARRDLAAAVDGRIVALGRSFYLRGQRPEFFSIMLPEDSLHAGRNRVELVEVARDGTLYRLARAP